MLAVARAKYGKCRFGSMESYYVIVCTALLTYRVSTGEICFERPPSQVLNSKPAGPARAGPACQLVPRPLLYQVLSIFKSYYGRIRRKYFTDEE